MPTAGETESRLRKFSVLIQHLFQHYVPIQIYFEKALVSINNIGNKEGSQTSFKVHLTPNFFSRSNKFPYYV